jgi:hypothetical protein
MSSNIDSLLAEVRNLLNSGKDITAAFANTNKSAQARVRRVLNDIRKLALEVRKDISAVQKGEQPPTEVNLSETGE